MIHRHVGLLIESANDRIKQWRYLGHILPSSLIPYNVDFVRVICAICNACYYQYKLCIYEYLQDLSLMKTKYQFA